MNLPVCADALVNFIYEVGEKVSTIPVRERSELTDQRIDSFMIDGLHRLLPGSMVISEESVHDVGLAPAEYVWLVDPIDGSNNYYAGMPWYAISVALIYRSLTIQAIVHDPVSESMWYADINMKYADSRSFPKSRERKMISMALAPHANDLAMPQKIMQRVIQKGVLVRVLGAHALSLAYVASGQLDGFVAWKYRDWDVAAGILLVQKAGRIIKKGDILIAGTEEMVEIIEKSIF